ncbi:MAG: FtsX-like permease family protein, partial [Rubrobacteraceae bacterium]
SKDLTAVDGVEGAATLNWTVADFRVGGSGKFEDWAISGFDEEFLAGGAPALEEFDRNEYPNEAAVWEAVAKDPKLAIADVAFLESGGGPPEDNVAVGDRIEVKAPAEDGKSRREVVAISAAGAAFSGVMVSKESLAGIVEDPVGNRHYLATSDGADAQAVAGRLQKEFLVNGLEARSFERVVEDALLRQAQFFDLIEGYLALGLLVGISGLGIVMVRAVRERRRQIGVLRALGLPPSSVRAAFLIESSVVALEGTLVGAVLALITGYQLIVVSSAFDDANTSLYIPWLQLLLLLAAVLLVSLVTTLPSATRAAAIPPATALRTMEEGGA